MNAQRTPQTAASAALPTQRAHPAHPARTATSPLRVAILSFAHVHAENYAQQLLTMPDVEVRGCDPHASSAPAEELRGAVFAEQIGISYAHTLDELATWQPHAVIVASENARHRELVEWAASVGAHVLCEKPLATTLRDGEAMIAACEAAGVTLMVAYPTRFTRHAKNLDALVGSGQLGTIIAASGANNSTLPVDRAWFTDTELAGGGALVDHVVHIADLLELILGQAPVRVHASVNNILSRGRAEAHARQTEADDSDAPLETGGFVTITYDSGLIATIDCSWSHPPAAPGWGGLSLELIGTLGSATIAPFDQHLHGFSEAQRAPLEISYGDDAYRRMLEEFLGAVRTGRQPQPDSGIGMRTMRIMLAAQTSARTGVAVDL